MADASRTSTVTAFDAFRWPRWARTTRKGLLIATALVGTAAGLAIALEKLGYNLHAACGAYGLCEPKPPIPQIPNYSSGFVEGGRHYSTPTYCDPQKRILDARYPDFDIRMTYLPEEHRVKHKHGLFKSDEYQYSCSFVAVPRASWDGLVGRISQHLTGIVWILAGLMCGLVFTTLARRPAARRG